MRFLTKSGGGLGDLAAEVALFRAIGQAGHELEIIVPQAHVELLDDCEFTAVIHAKPSSIMAKAGFYTNLLKKKSDVMLHMNSAGGSMLLHYFGNARAKRTARDMDPNLRDSGLTLFRLSILDGIIEGWKDSIATFIPFNASRYANAIAAAGIPYESNRTPIRLLTVAPGSYRKSKCWAIEYFADVVNKINSHFQHIVVVGSPPEAELCERLAKLCGAVSVAGKINLIETCALVSNSNLHIGNDSGLGHVSAANSIPTLAIGGMPQHKPWKQHMVCGEVAEISPEQVLAAIRAKQLI